MKRTKTRGFWGMFAAIGGATVIPFGVLWMLLYSFTREIAFYELLRLGILAGLLFGMIFGFIMAFLMQGDEITVAFEDENQFRERLDVALSLIGYRKGEQKRSSFTYKPTWRAGILAGRIWVELNERSASIHGPQSYLKRLQRKLQSA